MAMRSSEEEMDERQSVRRIMLLCDDRRQNGTTNYMYTFNCTNEINKIIFTDSDVLRVFVCVCVCVSHWHFEPLTSFRYLAMRSVYDKCISMHIAILQHRNAQAHIAPIMMVDKIDGRNGWISTDDIVVTFYEEEIKLCAPRRDEMKKPIEKIN